MQCSQCGHRVRGRALFCPNCGHKLELEEQTVAPQKRRAGAEADAKKGCGQSITVIVVAIVALVAIVGLGIAAVYFGLADRSETEQQAAQQHYQKGVAYMNDSNYELAIAEFELAIKLDPQNDQAIDRLSKARATLAQVPTPTPMLQLETKAAYLQELRKAHQTRDWAQVLDISGKLLALDPDYHRAEVDEVLFEAYYESGQQLVAEDRLREAVRLFDQALDLQPDNALVSRSKELASLYLSAMGYWGADWSKAAGDFQSLFGLQPDYKDVRQRLHDANVNLGDQLASDGDWCQAAQQYGLALAALDTAETAGKRQDAINRCNSSPEATPTESEGESEPGDTTPSTASGTYAGRLVEYTGLGGQKIFIRGKVLDSSGKGVAGVRVKIQAWDWTAEAISDGNGQYSFDGLSNEVTYTLTPLDIPAEPFDVEGVAGEIAWVNFEQAE